MLTLFSTLHNVSNENVERLQAKMAATFRTDRLGASQNTLSDWKPLLCCLKWTRLQLQMTGTKLTWGNAATIYIPLFLCCGHCTLTMQNRWVTLALRKTGISEKANCICRAAVRMTLSRESNTTIRFHQHNTRPVHLSITMSNTGAQTTEVKYSWKSHIREV